MRINCCATFLALAIFVVMLANIYFIFTLPKLIPKYMTHVGYYPSYLGEVPFITAATYCPCLMKWFTQMANKYNVDFGVSKEQLTPHIVDKVDEVEFDHPHRKYPYVAFLWVSDTMTNLTKFLCLCVMRSQDEWYDYNYPGQFICPRGNWRAPHYKWRYYHQNVVRHPKRHKLIMHLFESFDFNKPREFLVDNDEIVSYNAFHIIRITAYERNWLKNFLALHPQVAVSLKTRNHGIKTFNKYLVHYPIPEDKDERFVEWTLWFSTKQILIRFETDTFSRRSDVCNTFPVRGCSAYKDRTDFPVENFYEDAADYNFTGITRGITHHLLLTDCTGFGLIAMGTIDPSSPLPSINDPDCDTLYMHNCEEPVSCLGENSP